MGLLKTMELVIATFFVVTQMGLWSSMFFTSLPIPTILAGAGLLFSGLEGQISLHFLNAATIGKCFTVASTLTERIGIFLTLQVSSSKSTIAQSLNVTDR